MKVRVILARGYEYVYRVQVKRWWFPAWVSVYTGSEKEAVEVAERLVQGKGLDRVIFEGETK